MPRFGSFGSGLPRLRLQLVLVRYNAFAPGCAPVATPPAPTGFNVHGADGTYATLLAATLPASTLVSYAVTGCVPVYARFYCVRRPIQRTCTAQVTFRAHYCPFYRRGSNWNLPRYTLPSGARFTPVWRPLPVPKRFQPHYLTLR